MGSTPVRVVRITGSRQNTIQKVGRPHAGWELASMSHALCILIPGRAFRDGRKLHQELILWHNRYVIRSHLANNARSICPPSKHMQALRYISHDDSSREAISKYYIWPIDEAIPVFIGRPLAGGRVQLTSVGIDAFKELAALLSAINPYQQYGIWWAFREGSKRIPPFSTAHYSSLDRLNTSGLRMNQFVTLPVA